MTLNTFHGKILVEHQAGYHLNETPELLKAIEKIRDLSVSIELDRFGVSRISKVGILFGTLPKESRTALASRIETLVLQQCKTSIPFVLTHKKLYLEPDGLDDVEGLKGSGNEFTFTTFVKCPSEFHKQAKLALAEIFRKSNEFSDHLRPLIRFLPMESISLCLLSLAHVSLPKKKN
jgi:hypothetical protein